jgi:hypothetical protein
MLRQVTQPPHIAGPLAQMTALVFELAHPRTQQTFILTDIVLAPIFETPSRNVTLDSFILT